jgi:O-acetyl-ADP-ribose deacetylase (regulator of RNase III)
LTRGYKLPAKFVIHTVGPIWRGGREREDELLRACYTNSLQLAEKNGLTTIAFPSISTGAYGFPIEAAAEIAVSTVHRYLEKSKGIEKVVFVCFSKADYETYEKLLA